MHILAYWFYKWVSHILTCINIDLVSWYNISDKIVRDIYVFVVLWYLGSFVLPIVARLLQLIVTDSFVLVIIPKWYKNFLNQKASWTVFANTTNSASIVDSAAHVYFLLAHEMTPLFSRNIFSDVDFLPSRSPTQSASV